MEENAPRRTGLKNPNVVLGALLVWFVTGAVALATLTGMDRPKPAPPPVKGAPKRITWSNSFEEAMKRSRAEKRPVMVDFYTDWCTACKFLDSDVYTRPDIIASTANWIVVKVNAEKRLDIAQQYGVRAYPTIAFLRGDGRPLDYIVGAPAAEDLKSKMTSSLSTFKSQL